MEMSYIEEFIENLTDEQLDEAEAKIKEKKYGKPFEKPTKAYARPYGMDFVKTVLAFLRKAGISLPEEDEKKLKAMAGKMQKTGERLLISQELTLEDKLSGEVKTFSVLPQEEGRTGEELERETEEAAKAFIMAGKEHQKRKSLFDEEKQE